MRLALAAAVAALFFAYSPGVRAQSKVAVPPADDMEAAKAHFAAGSAYYEQADYLDAVKEFNEAYRLSKRTDLLYNIAVCYERLSDYDHAIATLRRYLVEKPDAPDRVTIETRIQNLQKLKEQAPAPRPAPTPAPTPAPSTGPKTTAAAPAPAPAPAPGPAATRPSRWWVPGTAVTASGLGVLIASLGTGLGAHALYEDLSSKCQNMTCPNDQNLKNEQSRGKALAIASDALLGIGAAVAVTGVVLLIVQSRHKSAPRAAWLRPAPGGLEVRF